MPDFFARLKSSPLRWPLLLLAVTIVALALMTMTSDKPTPSTATKPLWRVDTLPVALAPQSVDVRLYGRVETPKLVTLTAPVSAYVDATGALPGVEVEEGAVLVSLDQRDLQLVMAQRQAELNDIVARLGSEALRQKSDQDSLKQEQLLLESAERDFQRQQSLKNKSLVAARQVDAAREKLARQRLSLINRQQQVADAGNRMAQLEAQKQRFQALVNQVQLDLERSRMTAPFHGWVTRLEVAPGERVRAGDRVAELYPAGSLEVRAQIPDRYLTTVQSLLAEQVPVLAWAQWGDERIALELNRLDAAVGEGRGGLDGLFRVRGNLSVRLPLGRPLVLHLGVPSSQPALRIPPRALYDDRYVYRVDDHNTLQALEVKRLGSVHEDGQEWLVISGPGLKSGERLLLTRIANVVSGMEVEVIHE